MENRDIFDGLSEEVKNLSLLASEKEAGVSGKDIPGKPKLEEWVEWLKK